jgi:hypothetical protein
MYSGKCFVPKTGSGKLRDGQRSDGSVEKYFYFFISEVIVGAHNPSVQFQAVGCSETLVTRPIISQKTTFNIPVTENAELLILNCF